MSDRLQQAFDNFMSSLEKLGDVVTEMNDFYEELDEAKDEAKRDFAEDMEEFTNGSN